MLRFAVVSNVMSVVFEGVYHHLSRDVEVPTLNVCVCVGG